MTSADGAWLGCSIFLSGADYPELASSAQEGFSLDVGLGDQWNAKWVDGQKWFYTGMGPMSSTLDPDTKTVTLGSLEMQMAVDDPKETVSGTITCP